MKLVAQQLHDLLLRTIIPRYFINYVKPEYYPVIVGGVAIIRCLQMYPEVHDLIDDVLKSDIDVDFVVMGTTNATLKNASIAQFAFILDITRDTDFKQFFKKHPDHKFVIVRRKIPQKPKLQVITIKLKHGTDKPIDILDTVLIHTDTNGHKMNLYRSFFDSKYPIIRQTNANVLYGSCEWIYYDTVNMMFIYDRYLQKSDVTASASYRYFVFKKLVRYVLKFSALYIAVNKGNNEHIKAIYSHVLSLLKNSLVNNSVVTQQDPVIPDAERLYLHKVITAIIDSSNDITEFVKLHKEICKNNDC